MKPAREVSFVRSEDEKTLVGVFLKADFTAEHECGIDRLKRQLGIEQQEDRFGIENRRANLQREELAIFYQNGKHTVMAMADSWGFARFKEMVAAKESMKKILDHFDCRFYKDETLVGAWDDRRFAVAAQTVDAGQELRVVYDALIDGDLCVMLGGGNDNPFDRGGLALGIISHVPQSIKDSLHEGDKRAYDLKVAARATGIYDVVSRDAYFALSPRWIEDMCDSDKWDTEHGVVFWLNPSNQMHNASGYFTVEELTLWAKGEAEDGPIANRGRNYRTQQRIKAINEGDVSQLYSDELFCKVCQHITNVHRSYGFGRKTCDKCNGSESLILPKPYQGVI